MIQFKVCHGNKLAHVLGSYSLILEKIILNRKKLSKPIFVIVSYLILIITHASSQNYFFGDFAVLLLIGDYLLALEGEFDIGDSFPRIGDVSLTSLPTRVF